MKCPYCDGIGEIVLIEYMGGYQTDTCPCCEGTGEVKELEVSEEDKNIFW